MANKKLICKEECFFSGKYLYFMPQTNASAEIAYSGLLRTQHNPVFVENGCYVEEVLEDCSSFVETHAAEDFWQHHYCMNNDI